MVTEQEVRAQMKQVHDPCSVALGTPLNIEEMGLLQNIEIDGGQITITLDLTSPMCLMFVHFMREIEKCLQSLPGVTSVHVKFTNTLQWTPDSMTEEARQRLRASRVATIGGQRLPTNLIDPASIAAS